MLIYKLAKIYYSKFTFFVIRGTFCLALDAPGKAPRLHTWALCTKRWNQLDAIYWWHQWLRFILQFKMYPTNTQRKGKIHTSLCKSVLKTNGVQVRARSHWHSVTTRAYITKIAATEMHLKKFFVGVRLLLDLAAEADR